MFVMGIFFEPTLKIGNPTPESWRYPRPRGN